MVSRRLFLLPGRFSVACFGTVYRLFGAFFRSFGLAPRLAVKPWLLLVWLGQSHLAQVILFVTVAGMLTVFPDVTDRVVALVSGASSANSPDIAVLQDSVRGLIPFFCTVVVLLTFWLSIPSTIRRGRRMAVAMERQADGLVESDPPRSRKRYQRAIAFTISDIHAGRLRRKIMNLASLSRESARKMRAQEKLTKMKKLDLNERYETVRVLGRGRLGAVFLARDKVLDREVAVKELPISAEIHPELYERFEQEIKVLADFRHPGIIDILEVEEFGGNVWIVLEYVNGSALPQILQNRRIFTSEMVLRYGTQLAEALEYAHERGVLHRGLKPSLVMIDKQGQARIMDFIATRLKRMDKPANPAMPLETLAFMSPEQAKGQTLDERSDIFAFGAVLYNLLAGRRLFLGTAEEVIKQILHKKPQPIKLFQKDVPPRLSKLVMSMVVKAPNDRPASMSEVLAELEQIGKKM